MKKIINLTLIFILFSNCSPTKIPKYWSKDENVEVVKKEVIVKNILKKKCTGFLFLKKCKELENPNIKKTFLREKRIDQEFNIDLEIQLNTRLKINNNTLKNPIDNDEGRIDYDGDLKKISKYKFSKIENFNRYEPRPLLLNENIIFFDNKGYILNFNIKGDLLWKKNYYTKLEQKKKPILFFQNKNKTILVSDTIGKYYAIDNDTGNLLWSKIGASPFNSQIKIYGDKFFIVDFNNTLRAYNINNGNEIWNIKTESNLIRSQKKISLAIKDKNIFFNNSLGDITAVKIETGELLWQVPTQSSLVYDEGFFLQNSDIVINDHTLYFSNNNNQFFSIDIKTGIINWIQNINSHLKPIIINDLIFTVSLEGFLIIIEKNKGNIIKINYLFKDFDKKYLLEDKMLNHNIVTTGFVVAKNNIYLTTNKGKLHIIKIKDAKTIKILNIDKNKIYRPIIKNQNLFITTENSIIKLN